MFDLPGHILILTGSPGAGKPTTARSLVAASAAPAVHLHSDDFWHFIQKGAIPPYLPEWRKQNKVVIGILAKASEGYAKGGYFVVVDGIVGPWFIRPLTHARLGRTARICLPRKTRPPRQGRAVANESVGQS